MPNDVVYEFIRGDDFSITMTLTDPNNADAPVDLTDWGITSHLRNSRKLVAELDVVITNAVAGEFTISKNATNTATWPVRELKCDIQFDRPITGRISSQTLVIDVQEDQTYD